jgi:hypothetical protein
MPQGLGSSVTKVTRIAERKKEEGKIKKFTEAMSDPPRRASCVTRGVRESNLNI